MSRRRVLTFLALHAAYVAAFLALPPWWELRVERYVVTGAELIAAAFYAVIVVAFYKAQKTELNVELAAQKLYTFLLVAGLALPVALGVVLRGAPYVDPTNPYALWNPPGWARTYVWLGMAVTTVRVLRAFYRANWERSLWANVRRRARGTRP